MSMSNASTSDSASTSSSTSMWRNRNLWIILTGEAIAGLGMWVGIIGNLEFLENTVASDTLKSLIILCNVYVGLFLGPYAGRLIDTSSKKMIIHLSGLLRIVSVLFMFGALATGSVWWMVAYLLLLGTSATFFFPAWQAVLPMVVPQDQLLKANSLNMTIGTLTRVLGTTFGGILFVFMSLEAMYLCTILSYIGLFILTLFLRLPETKEAAPSAAAAESTAASASAPRPASGKFRELWPMLRQNPAVFSTLLLTCVPALFLGGFNLVILKISELQGHTSIKAWLYAAEGICFLIGSVLARRLGADSKRMPVLLGCTFVFAASHALLLGVSYPAAAVAAFAAFGLAAGVFFPITATLFQKEVAPELHGRFFSLRGMLDRLLFQIVLVATGVLLDVVGFRAMEGVLAVLAFALAFYYTGKQVRRSRVRPTDAGSSTAAATK